jgi:hypothetical protein
MASEKSSKTTEKDPRQDPDLQWLETPGIFCDTFAVDTWPSQVVRIVFGEYTAAGYQPFFRSAIVMPIDDAKQLSDAIKRSIEAFEKAAQTPEKPSS